MFCIIAGFLAERHKFQKIGLQKINLPVICFSLKIWYNCSTYFRSIRELDENNMIFETHAHYDDEQFTEDREEILASMKEGGIGTIVNVGASLASSRISVDLAESHPYIYAAAGIHPDHTGELDESSFQELRELLQREKVVAAGEIGLDYYWDEAPREVQKYWFVRQLYLAEELSLPVIIHSREAAADTMEILKEHAGRLSGGVIHCFSYSREMALEYVKMGFYIGVGGVVTFKNGRKLKETVEAVPLTSLVLETDSPYLAPVPNRGKRNSSLNLPYIAEQIAELKGVTYEQVVEQTEKNARSLYRI